MQRSYKIAAIFLIFCSAFWTFSIAFHDWIDAKVNLEFMHYILAGSSRAESSFHITDLIVTKILFYVVVVFESIISLLFIISCILMTRNFNDIGKFKCSKDIAVYAILLCIVKYFILFVCIFAEWFYMWQTSEMTQIKASIFTGLMLGMLVFLKVIDEND